MKTQTTRPHTIARMVRSLALLALAVFTCQTLAQEAAPSTSASPQLAGSRPNIIFIFTDDHAPHAISAYGSKINKTPNIDRLAKEGMLFRRSYCTNSICGPSRATILTGLHSHANGYMRNGNKFDGKQQTFPKLLQRAGYQTAIFGKWHLISDPTGFDTWMILPGQGVYYNPDFLTPKGRVRIEGYCTDVTTDLTLKWLEDQRDPDKPFMLMCQHKAPHRPWLPGPNELDLYRDQDIPEPATLFDDYTGRGPAVSQNKMEIGRHLYPFYDLMLTPTAKEKQNLQGPDRAWDRDRKRMNAEQRAQRDAAFEEENEAFEQARDTMSQKELVRWKYQRYIKNYLRCVAGVDRNVGRVLSWLDEHPKVAENTIVIYSSDQGFYLGDHGWFDKRWMYEESFMMPFIVRWPNKVPAGVENRELIQNIDYAPTFLHLAGIAPKKPMHGTSLIPLLEGKSHLRGRDALYYHYHESKTAHNVPAHLGITTDRYKLIHYYEAEHNYFELFDLSKDPDEMASVYGKSEYVQVQAALHRQLDELRKEFADPYGPEH